MVLPVYRVVSCLRFVDKAFAETLTRFRNDVRRPNLQSFMSHEPKEKDGSFANDTVKLAVRPDIRVRTVVRCCVETEKR